MKPPSISRRTFAAICAWTGCLLVVSLLVRAFRIVSRGGVRAHSAEPRRAGRRKRRSGKRWAGAPLVRNEASLVVHWPDASLFGRRGKTPKRIATFAPASWFDALKPREAPAKAVAGANASAAAVVERVGDHSRLPRFNGRMESLIRETLALSSLRVEHTAGTPANITNIEPALELLRKPAQEVMTAFAFHLESASRPNGGRAAARPAAERREGARPAPRKNRIRLNWRAPILYAKLVCLSNEADPKEAFLCIKAHLMPRGIDSGQAGPAAAKAAEGTPLAPLFDKSKFDKWHARVVDRSKGCFRRQLISRIQFAQNTVKRGASSNGQDTFGDGGSNPPATSLQYRRRARSISSRLLRRVKRAFRRRKAWLSRHLHPSSRRVRRARAAAANPGKGAR